MRELQGGWALRGLSSEASRRWRQESDNDERSETQRRGGTEGQYRRFASWSHSQLVASLLAPHTHTPLMTMEVLGSVSLLFLMAVCRDDTDCEEAIASRTSVRAVKEAGGEGG